jgi:hypothetical protein
MAWRWIFIRSDGFMATSSSKDGKQEGVRQELLCLGFGHGRLQLALMLFVGF